MSKPNCGSVHTIKIIPLICFSDKDWIFVWFCLSLIEWKSCIACLFFLVDPRISVITVVLHYVTVVLHYVTRARVPMLDTGIVSKCPTLLFCGNFWWFWSKIKCSVSIPMSECWGSDTGTEVNWRVQLTYVQMYNYTTLVLFVAVTAVTDTVVEYGAQYSIAVFCVCENVKEILLMVLWLKFEAFRISMSISITG